MVNSKLLSRKLIWIARVSMIRSGSGRQLREREDGAFLTAGSRHTNAKKLYDILCIFAVVEILQSMYHLLI